MFVIHKSTRQPESESYTGPSWDKAKIRHLYQPFYFDKGEAMIIAAALCRVNPIGFCVSPLRAN